MLDAGTLYVVGNFGRDDLQIKKRHQRLTATTSTFENANTP